MDYSLLVLVARMEISHAVTYLLHKEPRLVFGERLVSLVSHILIKGNATDVLLHQVYFLGRLKMVKQLAYLRVIQLLHACYFLMDCLELGLVIQLVLWVNLDCHSLFCILILC